MNRSNTKSCFFGEGIFWSALLWLRGPSQLGCLQSLFFVHWNHAFNSIVAYRCHLRLWNANLQTEKGIKPWDALGFITWIWVGLIHREVRNMLEDLVSGVQLRGVTRRRCGIIRLAHNVNPLAGRNASIFGGYKPGKIEDIPFVF